VSTSSDGLREVDVVELDASFGDVRRVPLGGERPATIRVEAWGDPVWSGAIVAVRDGSTPTVSDFAPAVELTAGSASAVMDDLGVSELELRVQATGVGERVRVRVLAG